MTKVLCKADNKLGIRGHSWVLLWLYFGSHFFPIWKTFTIVCDYLLKQILESQPAVLFLLHSPWYPKQTKHWRKDPMFLVQEKPQWLDPIQFEEVDHKKIRQTWRNNNKPWKYFIFKSNFIFWNYRELIKGKIQIRVWNIWNHAPKSLV